MPRFCLAELPSALAEHVPPRARLTFPPQGQTSDVAFAEHEGKAVVVKRCAHPVYLHWLRREHVVLRALAGSSLPIPRFISYAEAATNGALVGWLVMSRVAGSPLWSAVIEALPPQRESLFRRLGALLGRLHATPVPAEIGENEPWISRQLTAARGNLGWCDGTPAALAELERSRPEPATETLIHGDLALDNVLVDEHGHLGLIDWAGGGPGDARYDIALALQTKPELDLSAAELAAFFAGYGSAAVDEDTRDWFVRLYDFF